MSTNRPHRFLSTKHVGEILSYGLLVRFLLLFYCIIHDSLIEHIKYTDIDYHVFNNASTAILNGQSPYTDLEYRYSPAVALIFVPNAYISHFGKIVLILADILCGYIIYLLNIYQGTVRTQSKISLFIWLFNPITLAISTRGSFEPIQTLVVLGSIYMLIKGYYSTSGILYGLSIHLKLYPIIYSIALYGFMIKRKPYMITQSRLSYWFKTIKPGSNQIKFFSAAAAMFSSSCGVCYYIYGDTYLEQSFLYHFRRKDTQHNFSVYFYLFQMFPKYQDEIGKMAFIIQAAGILYISLIYLATDTNARIKIRKLNFSLFCTTFLFVSTNKVCTSQYFSWYIIYLPLIIDSLNIDYTHALILTSSWALAQINWLLFAYLLEYQNFDVMHHVGNSSLLFLICNMWILKTICQSFNLVKSNS